MFTNLKPVAAAAVVLATLAITTAQAKQVEADAPKTRTAVAQKLSKVTPAPYYWLVLGVGY